MAIAVPTHIHFKIKPPHLHQRHLCSSSNLSATTITAWRNPSSLHRLLRHRLLHLKLRPSRTVLRNVSASAGDGTKSQEQSLPSDVEALKGNSSNFGDGYVPLFVRMLGLDNDPLDREQAIVALWKYSLGGKQYVDTIMQFHGCLNLTVNLLKSESVFASEAAAGLLRMISSFNLYRGAVVESGAIEEITGLLNRSSLSVEVKEQSICTLWNLSVDEDFRAKIASSDLLPLLIKYLNEDDIKVKESVGGVLANLALSHSNHSVMVEAGVIPLLAKLLQTNVEGYKVIRKEARNALLELIKDDYYRILVIEEGLVPVPMIGAAAYRSLKPVTHSWPSLPDGTEFERRSNSPSKYGASELLLGLNIDNDINIEETKMKAIVGRTQQQFLARIGAIETEDSKFSQSEIPRGDRYTLLPWMDGVARLVLILSLEDESAIIKASESISDVCINEQMRNSFKEAGAIKRLVQLLNHNNCAIKLALTSALERLSMSNEVCRVIEAEGAIYHLANILKHPKISESLTEKTLDVLARILDPSKEMASKFYDGSFNGSRKELGTISGTTTAQGLTGDMDAMPISASVAREDFLDSAVIARLVGILKTPLPNLQRKAASILEFVTNTESFVDPIMSVDIESGLNAVFQQKILKGMEVDTDSLQPELHQVEEAGRAISAASRLLTKLLDSEQFRNSINSTQLASHLRKILRSSIPLQNKEWAAASLIKLSSLAGPDAGFEDPISMEVALYEMIPRLVEQMKKSVDPESQEAAAMELNRIVVEGFLDSTRAVAAEGGIFPLVKLIQEGSERAAEAGLAVLYSLGMDIENHPAIVAAGAVPALRKYIVSQKPQWMRALRLLRLLPT